MRGGWADGPTGEVEKVAGEAQAPREADGNGTMMEARMASMAVMAAVVTTAAVAAVGTATAAVAAAAAAGAVDTKLDVWRMTCEMN